MKSGLVKLLYSLATLAALTLPNQLTAQNGNANTSKHHHYKLIDLGTLGGPNSYFTFIGTPLNNRGVATGFADTASGLNPPFCLVDCFVTHTFQWKNGALIDLGAFPGIGAGFPNDINANGVVVGLSLNGGFDAALGLPFFDAAVWKDGQVIDLGTFGGSLSYGAAINNRNEAVGFALNPTPDSFDLGDSCQNYRMPTQMRAFIWRHGVKQNLGTLGGTDSCALFINEHGQVAGNSFTDSDVHPSTALPTLHPFFWDGEKMIDLHTLGGNLAVATGINDRGQVGGYSFLDGDQTVHAFFWEDGKLTDVGSLGGDFLEVIGFNQAGELVGQAQLTDSAILHAFFIRKGTTLDLGTLAGDPCSAAISANVEGQVVGFSHDCSLNNQRAFFWENGQLTDLNVFVPASSNLTLLQGDFINDRGEIAGEGALPNGDLRAVLLIPCEAGEEGCMDGGEAPPVAAATRSQRAAHSAVFSPRRSMTPSERAAAWRVQFFRRSPLPVEGAPRN